MIEYAEENHRYGNCERCGENPIDCKCKPVEKTQDEKIIEILDDPRVWVRFCTNRWCEKITSYSEKCNTYIVHSDHYNFNEIKKYFSYSYSHRGRFKPLSEV